MACAVTTRAVTTREPGDASELPSSAVSPRARHVPEVCNALPPHPRQLCPFHSQSLHSSFFSPAARCGGGYKRRLAAWPLPSPRFSIDVNECKRVERVPAVRCKGVRNRGFAFALAPVGRRLGVCTLCERVTRRRRAVTTVSMCFVCFPLDIFVIPKFLFTLSRPLYIPERLTAFTSRRLQRSP